MNPRSKGERSSDTTVIPLLLGFPSLTNVGRDEGEALEEEDDKPSTRYAGKKQTRTCLLSLYEWLARFDLKNYRESAEIFFLCLPRGILFTNLETYLEELLKKWALLRVCFLE